MHELRNDLEQEDSEEAKAEYFRAIALIASYKEFTTNVISSLDTEINKLNVSWASKFLLKRQAKKIVKHLRKPIGDFTQLSEDLYTLYSDVLDDKYDVAAFVTRCGRVELIVQPALILATQSYQAFYTMIKQITIARGRK